MGLAMGHLNTKLWAYEFDYIIPYVNLLDPSWDLFLFHMGLAMGLFKTILSNYFFNYIIPYVNLLDLLWDFFLFHMGLAMGPVKFHFHVPIMGLLTNSDGSIKISQPDILVYD